MWKRCSVSSPRTLGSSVLRLRPMPVSFTRLSSPTRMRRADRSLQAWTGRPGQGWSDDDEEEEEKNKKTKKKKKRKKKRKKRKNNNNKKKNNTNKKTKAKTKLSPKRWM